MHNSGDMPEIDSEVPIDDAYLEWMRVRFATVGGRVTPSRVQNETGLDGRRVPVARFDNAHGFARRDLLDVHGRTIDKRRFLEDTEPGLRSTLGNAESWTTGIRIAIGSLGHGPRA